MKSAGMREAIVAGMAVECCLGSDLHTFWQGLRAGRSGIAELPFSNEHQLPVRYGAILDHCGPDEATAVERRRTAPFQQYLCAVVERAIRGFEFRDPGRVALIVGTAGGSLGWVTSEILGDQGRYEPSNWARYDPFFVLKGTPGLAASAAAAKFNIRGPVLTISTSCAASTDSMVLGLGMLRAGSVDAVVVAGVEMWVTPEHLAAFSRLGAVSTQLRGSPAAASRPFDVGRDGMVPSDGAAALLLTTEAEAERNGLDPSVALLGGASNCDAFHPVAPRPDGSTAAAAIRMALADASCNPEDVQHLNAHGTATTLNDIAESRAIAAAFGRYSEELLVTANKSVLGHCLGASGALEAIASVLSIEEQCAPPIANLDEVDSQCSSLAFARQATSLDISRLVKTSFGFGGQNSVLVFGKVD